VTANPTDNRQYVTNVVLSLLDELRTEVKEASFSIEKLPAMRGPVIWMKSFDADRRDTRMRASLLLELLGAPESVVRRHQLTFSCSRMQMKVPGRDRHGKASPAHPRWATTMRRAVANPFGHYRSILV